MGLMISMKCYSNLRIDIGYLSESEANTVNNVVNGYDVGRDAPDFTVLDKLVVKFDRRTGPP